jgi:hypothetical protein
MSVHLHENTSKSRALSRVDVLPPARISVLVILALTGEAVVVKYPMPGAVQEPRRPSSIMPTHLVSSPPTSPSPEYSIAVEAG